MNYLVPLILRHDMLAWHHSSTRWATQPSQDHRRSKVKLVWIELLISNKLPDT